MATTALTKDEFVNESPGYAGVVTLNPKGEPQAIAVGPRETIWLSEDEQILTANAPQDAKDNPLVNGTFRLVRAGQEIRNRRPLRPDDEPEPATAVASAVAAAPTPEGPAAEGTRPPGEEVGTPDAIQAGGARRRRAKAD